MNVILLYQKRGTMRASLQNAKRSIESVRTKFREEHGYCADLVLHFNGNDDNEDVIILPLRHLSREQYIALLEKHPEE